MDVIRKSMDELHAYLRRKSLEIQLVEERLRASVSLNHRQLALLSHAVRHPHQAYTIESHMNSHNISYQTARTDLLGLKERGVLSMKTRGKLMVFSPVRGLEQRLTELE